MLRGVPKDYSTQMFRRWMAAEVLSKPEMYKVYNSTTEQYNNTEHRTLNTEQMNKQNKLIYNFLLAGETGSRVCGR